MENHDILRNYWELLLADQFDAREIAQMWRMLIEDLVRPRKMTLTRALISDWCSEIKSGKPIQHITGIQHFYRQMFFVNEQVLIPRPETEELVDWVLRDNDDRPRRVLDVGSGSGCIAISLKAERPAWSVDALDISEKALEVARMNAEKNHIDIHWMQKDILSDDFTELGPYDIIVSNPPYITKKEKVIMDLSVSDYEPKAALFVDGSDPLLFYKKIIHLSPGGLLDKCGKLYFECSEFFARDLLRYCLEEHTFSDIALQKDMQGKDRMLRILL